MAGKATGRTSHAPGVVGRFGIDPERDDEHYRRTAQVWASAQVASGVWFICRWEGAWWAMPPGADADAARSNPTVTDGYDYEV